MLKKIIFGILASHNEQYNDFKQNLINHISHFKNSPYAQCIDFYFLYSEPNKADQCLENINNLYYNYYSDINNTDTLMISFVRRTFSFLKYLHTNNISLDYFIRTNITTLFDYNKLLRWLDNKPDKLFSAGTFIADLNYIYTSLSGTNITISKDIIPFLINNEHNILYNLECDDVIISSLIIENLDVTLSNIKRVDFVQILDHYESKRHILFNGSYIYDNDVFCFRFKTLDRFFDVKLMNKISNLINKNSNYQINSFIDNLKKVIKIDVVFSNQPIYRNLTQNYKNFPLFKFDKSLDLFKEFYRYKDHSIIY